MTPDGQQCIIQGVGSKVIHHALMLKGPCLLSIIPIFENFKNKRGIVEDGYIFKVLVIPYFTVFKIFCFPIF